MLFRSTAQRPAARHALHRLRRAAVPDDVDVPHSSPDAHLRLEVVVRLDQRLPAVVVRAAQAPEVDQGVPLDGLTAALVLPAAHHDDDVHGATVGEAGVTGD